MAKPAVGVAESLGALEDGKGVHIDEVRRQVLGQTLEPLPLVGDEDRDHELIYPIGDGFGTTAQWHGGRFADTRVSRSDPTRGPDVEALGRMFTVVGRPLVRLREWRSPPPRPWWRVHRARTRWRQGLPVDLPSDLRAACLHRRERPRGGAAGRQTRNITLSASGTRARGMWMRA